MWPVCSTVVKEHCTIHPVQYTVPYMLYRTHCNTHFTVCFCKVHCCIIYSLQMHSGWRVEGKGGKQQLSVGSAVVRSTTELNCTVLYLTVLYSRLEEPSPVSLLSLFVLPSWSFLSSPFCSSGWGLGGNTQAMRKLGLENPMVDHFVQLITKHSSVELSWWYFAHT